MELIKWKENMRRCAELGCHPPDLLLAYRAMESIFSAVFDKAEPQLHHRWVNLRNDLGPPHLLALNAIQKVGEFAEAELGALVLHGGTGLNTGPPLTDNQKTRQQQIRESDKKKAAALKAPPSWNQNQAHPQGAARFSSTTASCAAPCKAWAERGFCQQGNQLALLSPRVQPDGEPVHHLWF